MTRWVMQASSPQRKASKVPASSEHARFRQGTALADDLEAGAVEEPVMFAGGVLEGSGGKGRTRSMVGRKDQPRGFWGPKARSGKARNRAK